ncbi:MAG: type II toxin-antitoxin system RelE/ParE family toxin [Prolixibacteraceae bacterium]|nr:type II toxin-antitoxin system RelE/ParE family toxin [Prolixibacteraceae bacterium]
MGKMYKILFRKSAEKQLLALPKKTGYRIIQKIRLLSEDPFPNGVKKMVGFKNLFRLRTGDSRIIYMVEKEELIIEIIKIGNRQNIYK